MLTWLFITYINGALSWVQLLPSTALIPHPLLHNWQTCINGKLLKIVLFFSCQRHVKLIEAEWRIYASVNFTIISSDNGLSLDRCQAIIWPNAGILLIGPSGTNFSEIEIQRFSFRKMHLKMSSGKSWPLYLGLNVLKVSYHKNSYTQ